MKEDRKSSMAMIEMAISIKDTLQETWDFEYAFLHIDLAFVMLGLGNLDLTIKQGIKANVTSMEVLRKKAKVKIDNLYLKLLDKFLLNCDSMLTVINKRLFTCMKIARKTCRQMYWGLTCDV
jgi:hypothetical protein